MLLFFVIAVSFEPPIEDRFIFTEAMFLSDTLTVRKVYDDEVALMPGAEVVPWLSICGALPSTPVVRIVVFMLPFKSVVFICQSYTVSAAIAGDVALNQMLIDCVVFSDDMHSIIVLVVFEHAQSGYPELLIVELPRVKDEDMSIVVLLTYSFAVIEKL